MSTQDKEPSNECCNNKHSYEGDMENRLRDLGKNIDCLLEKADDSKSQAIENLKAKRDDASCKLKELKESSKEAWEELKKGTDRAWNDLQSAWDEMKVAGNHAKEKFQH